MLKITLCIARSQLSSPTLAGLTEYRKRLSKTCQLSWQTGFADHAAGKPVEQSAQTVRIRLDRRGQAMTSPELAERLQSWMVAGFSTIRVELGQTNDPELAAKGRSADSLGDLVLSLSPLALSVDLATLLMAEQIYRAFRILGNQPYHK